MSDLNFDQKMCKSALGRNLVQMYSEVEQLANVYCSTSDKQLSSYTQEHQLRVKLLSAAGSRVENDE